MKHRFVLSPVITMILVTLVSVQVFGQFQSKGIRLGAAGGFWGGLTQNGPDNAFNAAARIFLRHNIADNVDGDLSGSYGSLEGDELPHSNGIKYYQTDLYTAEYKILYKPYILGDWEPYIGAGLGVAQYNTNWHFRAPGASPDGYVGYLPITLGTEYAITDKLQVDINAHYDYAFSNEVVSSWYNRNNSNDAWWGIFVGVSYTIFGGSNGEAEQEALRVKAEQDALHAKELAMAVAKRLQDSVNAAADAEAQRIQQENAAAEAKRIQEANAAAALAKRIQDSTEAATKKHAIVPQPAAPQPVALNSEVGKAIVLEGVQFKTGSAVLSPESEQILGSAKKTLEENPKMIVEIRGYTDNSGSSKMNLQISQNRANAVKAWLVKKGISAKRISAKGFGSNNPVASNKTEEGRQKNRRIEFFRTK